MTLIIAESFDRYDVNDEGSPWTSSIDAGGVVMDTGRGGDGKCMRIDSTGYENNSIARPLPYGAEWYVGMSIKVVRGAVPHTNSNRLIQFTTAGNVNNNNAHLNLYIDTAGTLILMGKGGVMGSCPAGVLLDAWASLELYVRLGDAGSCTVKINGTTVIQVDGDFRYSNFDYLTIVSLFIYQLFNETGSSVSIDNLYVCDAAGAVHNTFLGDVRFAPLNTLVDSTPSDFTAVGAGTTDADRVNDQTPVTTTYLEGDTVGNQERFTIAPVGVDAESIVALVVSSYAKKDAGGARSVKSTVVSGATTEHSADHSLADTYEHTTDIFPVDPNTSAAWTKTNADAVVIGVEITV